jgi:hypothetical protein
MSCSLRHFVWRPLNDVIPQAWALLCNPIHLRKLQATWPTAVRDWHVVCSKYIAAWDGFSDRGESDRQSKPGMEDTDDQLQHKPTGEQEAESRVPWSPAEPVEGAVRVGEGQGYLNL